MPGWGSRSIRSWSTLSVSDRLTGQGCQRSVPRLAIQATVAGSVVQTSSAVRPDGNVMVAVCTQSGIPRLGARFW